MSEALIKEGQGRGDSMEQSVKDVVALFKRSLQLFAQCHNIYNKKIITEDDIIQLGIHMGSKMQTYNIHVYSHTIHVYSHTAFPLQRV